jgi:putative tryptophan/tyrosine transport system substrate-binding protein
MTTLAGKPGGGLILPIDAFTTVRRDLVFDLAARNRLPAIYGVRNTAAAGGLSSYSIDLVGLLRQAAGYVDRILRGEKAADLPVQKPAKFRLVLNAKSAKALGLDIPPKAIALADEVIG